ncbi:MAG TPA: hypothetical protein VJT84_08255 [Gaiellaceae bacterium]|nr:hypothetical protein [Gaiellaceae bacterium]
MENFVVLGEDNAETAPTGFTNTDAGPAITASRGGGASTAQVASPGGGVVARHANRPGGLFTSGLPGPGVLTSTLAVVGLGQHGGGFFFQGDDTPDSVAGPAAGVTALGTTRPGGVFTSGLPWMTGPVTQTLAVIGLGRDGGGLFFQGDDAAALPDPRPTSGLHGVSADPQGAGVVAEHTLQEGEALRVIGRASFVTASGKAVVPKGQRKVTVTGVPLSDDAIVLATTQAPMPAVAGVTLDLDADSFVINLAGKVTKATPVGWLVVN